MDIRLHQETLKEVYNWLKALGFPDHQRLHAPHRPPNDVVLRIVEFVIEALEPKINLTLWPLLDNLLFNLQWPNPSHVEFTELELHPSNIESMWPALVQALDYLVKVIGVPTGQKENLSTDLKMNWAIESYIITLFNPSSADATASAQKEQMNSFFDQLNGYVSEQKRAMVELKDKKASLAKKLDWRANLSKAEKECEAQAALIREFIEDTQAQELLLDAAIQSTLDKLVALERTYAELKSTKDRNDTTLKQSMMELSDLSKAATELKWVSPHLDSSQVQMLRAQRNELSDEYTNIRCSLESELGDLGCPVSISLHESPVDKVKQAIQSLSAKKRQLSADNVAIRQELGSLNAELAGLDEGSHRERLESTRASTEKKLQAFDNFKQMMDEERQASERSLRQQQAQVDNLKEELDQLAHTVDTKIQEQISEENVLAASFKNEVGPILERLHKKRQWLDTTLLALEEPVHQLVECADGISEASKEANRKIVEIEASEVELDDTPLETAKQSFDQALQAL